MFFFSALRLCFQNRSEHRSDDELYASCSARVLLISKYVGISDTVCYYGLKRVGVRDLEEYYNGFSANILHQVVMYYNSSKKGTRNLKLYK